MWSHHHHGNRLKLFIHSKGFTNPGFVRIHFPQSLIKFINKLSWFSFFTQKSSDTMISHYGLRCSLSVYRKHSIVCARMCVSVCWGLKQLALLILAQTDRKGVSGPWSTTPHWYLWTMRLAFSQNIKNAKSIFYLRMQSILRYISVSILFHFLQTNIGMLNKDRTRLTKYKQVHRQ